MEPKISVIIPVYNVEKYLKRCVESVCNQTFSDMEIILVNDGSTDTSGILCDKLVKKDARIKVVHKSNGGLSDARNAGFACAKGEWISFIDSDDWIEEHFFEYLMYEAEKQQVDIVGCAYRKVFENQNCAKVNEHYSVVLYNDSDIMSSVISNKIQQVVWNKIYKKTLLNGILFEKGKYHEDEFWSYQVFAKVNQYVEIDYGGYNYFQRADSIMAEKYSLKRLHAVEAKVQRQKYLEDKLPDMASKGKINLVFTCFYHGQLALQQLTGSEKKEAISYLSKLVKRNKIENREMSNLSVTHKLWIYLSRISFITTCRLRNICKIGL